MPASEEVLWTLALILTLAVIVFVYVGPFIWEDLFRDLGRLLPDGINPTDCAADEIRCYDEYPTRWR